MKAPWELSLQAALDAGGVNVEDLQAKFRALGALGTMSEQEGGLVLYVEPLCFVVAARALVPSSVEVRPAPWAKES